MKIYIKKYLVKALLSFAKCDDGLHDWIYAEMEEDENFPEEFLNDERVWKAIDKKVEEFITLLTNAINSHKEWD